MGKVKGLILQCLILIIRTYQYVISPLLGPCCRFHPSCSVYAVDAIKLHGFFRGFYLILRRILRCHPWCQGGVDTVPEKNIPC